MPRNQSESNSTIGSFILDRYNDAKNTLGAEKLRSRLASADRAWRQYWSSNDHNYDSEMSQYVSGIIYSNCRAITSRGSHVLFQNDPYFEPVGYDASDDAVVREVITPYTSHQLDQIDFQTKNRRALEYWPKYGTVIISTPWRTQVKKKRVTQEVETVDEDGSIVMKTVKDYMPETVYDNVDFVVEDLMNVHYIGKNVKSINSSNPCEALAIDNWMTMEELRSYRDLQGWNIKNLDLLTDKISDTPTAEYKHIDDNRKTGVGLDGCSYQEQVGRSQSKT